jgi:hypothetical protein
VIEACASGTGSVIGAIETTLVSIPDHQRYPPPRSSSAFNLYDPPYQPTLTIKLHVHSLLLTNYYPSTTISDTHTLAMSDCEDPDTLRWCLRRLPVKARFVVGFYPPPSKMLDTQLHEYMYKLVGTPVQHDEVLQPFGGSSMTLTKPICGSQQRASLYRTSPMDRLLGRSLSKTIHAQSSFTLGKMPTRCSRLYFVSQLSTANYVLHSSQTGYMSKLTANGHQSQPG